MSQPKQHNRRNKRSFTASLSVAAAGGILIPNGVAHADPEPTEEEVQDRIEELSEEISDLVEEYNVAEEDLDSAESRLDEVEEQIESEENNYDELRESVVHLASSAYQGSDLESPTTALAVDDPADLIEQADDLDYLSENRSALLEEYVGSAERLEGLRADADTEYEEAQEHLDELAEQREEIEEALAEQEALLADFEGDNPTTGDASQGASYDGDASGNARTALDFAYAQVGTPYQWGGTGPDGYDCSGLMQTSWAQAGVSIPRTTGQQYQMPNRVSRGQLRPGDIMFFYEGISHNGMYAGDGQMVHSPSSGRHVEVVNLADYWDQHFQGAVRP
ncbi:NlpC/P60 family protein [Lipingzhangella sp. LS1_29]|uniref:NlpC/P60 family protein n=1 Tax=Lipingzhangella rawalii TaxID=2055835 RepID=A0ABU2H9Z6_9ACTN|nr:NlpC/P60 family protein [Lipingzhangella rawalii]MDS1271414.1 NlpC/P60 family protein [Lipingzhangella rawalii]